jgi:hypothetical protein
LQAAYIHSPFAGILTAARIWPSQDFTLYLLEYTSFGPNQRTVLIHTRRFSCRQD